MSLDTENDGGPSPRSCHKMVLNTKTRQIFILGRYLERVLRDRAQNIKVSLVNTFYFFPTYGTRHVFSFFDTIQMGCRYQKIHQNTRRLLFETVNYILF